MKLEELSIFKASVENNLGYNIENTPNYQNTAINAAMGYQQRYHLIHLLQHQK
jgi:undecaprenyl pyrophosphate synthase